MLHDLEFNQTVKIPYYSNMRCSTLGLDSEEHCFDRKFFNQFGPVDYQFNEIGYRTESVTKFTGSEILAIGDSFTLGLGVNYQDTWPVQLSKLINYPVLNFSLNGGSNDWMARKTAQLLRWFKPRAVVVHYTFSHRRECNNSDWFDDERTECEPLYSDLENLQNWRSAFDYFSGLAIPVVHSFITDWHPEYVSYQELGTNVICPITKIDLARDSFHYGANTHRLLAEKITNLLVPG